MSFTTNRDIWSEVLCYFGVDLVADSKEDITFKRRTILSIALTHPDLVDVALDELWRSMESLEPIVHILNAPLEESRDVLGYNEGFWGISVPDKGPHPFLQTCSYLSRVQYLHFATFPTQKEHTLWAAISTLGQLLLLCAGLQKIRLGSGFDAHVQPGAIYNLAQLISPALHSVIFDNTISDGRECVAITTLLSLFRCRDIQLHKISYHGFVFPCVIQLIFEFPTLHSMVIQPQSQANLERVYIRLFCRMENLTKLDIHLGIFPSTTSVGDWLMRLPSLLTLRLSGLWGDIYPCIYNQNYRSLQLLSLFLEISRSPSLSMAEQYMFSHISASFPRLKSFRLTLHAHVPDPYMITTLEILSLRKRLLHVLELQYLPVSLSTTNIVDILTVWPSLKHLCIVPQTGDLSYCEAKVVLLYMSNYAPNLQSIDLPLDFLSLMTSFVEAPKCICPLQKLDLTQALSLPQNLPEKLILGRNLISLLPRLITVTSSKPNSNADVSNDLQAITKHEQHVSSLLPQRHGH